LKYCAESRHGVLTAIKKTIPLYSFDQYKLYAAADKTSWQEYLLQRLIEHLQSKDGCVFFEIVDGLIYLVGCSISRWDEEHFGFRMAKINWLVYPDSENANIIMGKLLDDCINYLRDSDVRFVSAHISGEDLIGLHLLEDRGFRYYQTTVYSIAECTNLSYKSDPAVRLWRKTDLPAVIEIAKHNQFSRGHFYSDGRFDRRTVDLMYEKWIRTSWKNKEPIAVIEKGGKVAGYFAFVMDEALSHATKHRYGRMTSLAMDASIRSRGLGSSLLRSVISLIGERGGQYVASEYPLKNYTSDRLHTKNMFYTVHEKVLSHLWL
jgi:L-amino acid N-acyltransferase YncA